MEEYSLNETKEKMWNEKRRRGREIVTAGLSEKGSIKNH